MRDVACAQEREFVQGQRPADSRRGHEGHRRDGRAFELAEQRAHGLFVTRAVKRQRSWQSRLGSRAGGDDEHVVRDHLARRRIDDPCRRVHRCDQSWHMPRADVGYDPVELEVVRATDAERLRDGERSVGEVRLGRDDADSCSAGRELGEAEQELEGSDARTDHDDARYSIRIEVGHRFHLPLASRFRRDGSWWTSERARPRRRSRTPCSAAGSSPLGREKSNMNDRRITGHLLRVRTWPFTIAPRAATGIGTRSVCSCGGLPTHRAQRHALRRTTFEALAEAGIGDGVPADC